MIPKRLPKKLKLGNYYIVYWINYRGRENKMVCKFIQPTKCGFNLLNIETNKCILNRHVYPSKCENHQSGDWFWFNENLKIISIG